MTSAAFWLPKFVFLLRVWLKPKILLSRLYFVLIMRVWLGWFGDLLHVGKNTNILLQQTTVLNDLSYCSNCTALKFALFSIYYLCFWGSQSQNYLKDIIHHQKLIALFKRALRVKTYVDDVILLRGRLMKLEATYTTWGKADVYNKDAFYYFNFFHSL